MAGGLSAWARPKTATFWVSSIPGAQEFSRFDSAKFVPKGSTSFSACTTPRSEKTTDRPVGLVRRTARAVFTHDGPTANNLAIPAGAGNQRSSETATDTQLVYAAAHAPAKKDYEVRLIRRASPERFSRRSGSMAARLTLLPLAITKARIVGIAHFRQLGGEQIQPDVASSGAPEEMQNCFMSLTIPTWRTRKTLFKRFAQACEERAGPTLAALVLPEGK
jgi:hypothetical protein